MDANPPKRGINWASSLELAFRSMAWLWALHLLATSDHLTPKFMALRPGTRIVANHFGIDGWQPEDTQRVEGDCMSWCTSLLYIVPANVSGTWRVPNGELTLEQKFQTLTGSITRSGTLTEIEKGTVRGDQISFTVAGAEYTGRVRGDAITGEITGNAKGVWSAKRVRRD
jgi:hypothetical protein